MNPWLHSERDLRDERLESGNAAALQEQVSLPAETNPVAAEPRRTDQAPALSAAAEAFNLFGSGKLSECAFLIALGVARAGYIPSEELRPRA